MRTRLCRWTAAGLAVAVAGWAAPASAQLTYDASSILSVELGSSPPLVLTTPGGVSSVNGGLGGPVGLFGGDFSGSPVTTLSPNAAPPLTSLSLINGGNLSGTITPIWGGTLGILGTVNVNAFGALFIAVPMNLGTAGAGIGGTATFGVFGSRVTFGSWTTGTATITLPYPPTLSFRTGSDNRTPGGLGQINLVTPIAVNSTLGGFIPMFGTLTLNFVPEPGTPLLLGSGIALLAVLHRRRHRAR